MTILWQGCNGRDNWKTIYSKKTGRKCPARSVFISSTRSRWHGQLSVKCFLGSSSCITSSCTSHFGYQVPWLEYTHFLSIRTGLLTGMPRRHQDTWSRSSPSWYQKDSISSTSGGDKVSDGNAGWSQRDTRGTSSSGRADNTGTSRRMNCGD